MSTHSTRKTSAKLGLILLAYIAFISLGLPDGLLGVAWPSIRADFSQPLDSLGFMLLAGMAGYLTSSFLSGQLMARLGVGGLLAASCAITGAGLIGYTLVPTWWMMVALGAVAGLGAGAIDAGINTYIAANHGEGLMQWLHASFGIGVTLGPIIMTTGINQFNTWRLGYVIVGTAQITLGLCFALTAKMWQRADEGERTDENQRLTDYKTSLGETLRQPRVWLSILMFFIYTGIELSLGHWAYTLLTESRGVDPEVAGLWAGSYWGTFTLGRILAGLYAQRLGGHAVLRFSMLAALLGAILLWWAPVQIIGLLGVAVTGFAVAPIFPALVSGTSKRVGAHHAANTIGMQIGAAGLGGSILPGIAGVLARRISLEVIPLYLIGLIVALLLLYGLTMRGRE
ncbi:MAG: MFS transporter [Chloroflexi bacterium]|nr:MFS transporter [Chloroflexota bacterium]MBP8054945.1 MFS transporter [Chloroflexota bacterium]